MSVEKRGAAYLVRWRDSSGKQRSKTVTRKRDADALDGEMKRKRAMGELVTHEKGKIRLQDFWEVWWQNYALVHLSLRTQDTYRRLIEKHVLPVAGRAMMSAVDREMVTGLMTSWNSKLGARTQRQLLAILQGVFERAIEWDYITRNPIRGTKKPKITSSVGRAITWDELSALVSELPSLRDKTIVRVLAATGMRPGELRALTWEDVRADRVTITKAATTGLIGPTKTNQLRSVRAYDSCYTALREWSLASSKPEPRALIFPGADGRVWTDNGWRLWQQRVFAQAAARAGLRGLRPYDLRHTYASHRIAEGADIMLLARQLGHSATMTLTVYGHLLARESVYSECNEDLAWAKNPEPAGGLEPPTP